MTISGSPKLCGGTFFVLVLQALKPRIKARQHYKGERDGLSEPEVLIGLIKVINPDYIEPKEGALKGKTNDFKSCKTSNGKYLPFGDTPEIETFDERVRTNYKAALDAMTEFINTFLETGTAVQKEVRLVKALIDLIEQDKSIQPEDVFYIGENGGQIKKTALGGLDDVCLPAFLLGVLHFIVVNRKDNSVGKSTYDEWCPQKGGAPRIYTSNMGKRIVKKINVYMPGITEENNVSNISEEYEEQTAEEHAFDDKTNSTSIPFPNQTVMHNPLFISQTGVGSSVIPNYGTINLTLGKHGGGSDEQ